MPRVKKLYFDERHTHLGDYDILIISEMILSTSLLFILFPGAYFVQGRITDTTHLFDLNSEPNEESIFDPTSVETNASYNTLLERSAYWANYVISAAEDTDSAGTNKKQAWKKSGGISSWTVSEDFTAPVIPLKYSNSDAPNIVFVLVDDWVS